MGLTLRKCVWVAVQVQKEYSKTSHSFPTTLSFLHDFFVPVLNCSPANIQTAIRVKFYKSGTFKIQVVLNYQRYQTIRRCIPFLIILVSSTLLPKSLLTLLTSCSGCSQQHNCQAVTAKSCVKNAPNNFGLRLSGVPDTWVTEYRYPVF